MEKINVVLVGLGFGGAFADIYQQHPAVASIGLCDANPAVAQKVAAATGITKIYGNLDEVLADANVDAVHLVTPIPLHEEQTIAVLESGKHCACTVPMALSTDGLQRIKAAVRRSGKNFMMMETTLYTYQFFYVREMIASGRLGRVQFLRGSHYQDMTGWPDYWMGLPPMWYGTHAIAPLVALSGSRITRVHCFGSGTMADWLTKPYGNPYPLESALFDFANGLKGEATRSLFETARAYQEGLFVYGSEASFEWGFRDGDQPYVTTLAPVDPLWRGRPTPVTAIELPNYYQTLPEPLQKFTVGKNFDPLNPQDSLRKGAGAGHHGSHPHLVHEFVTSIIENRKPWIDEELGGNITAAGLCAHQSAMLDGAAVEIPG